MLKHSKEFSRLKAEWKKSWKEDVADVLIFGSYVKGKAKPQDIDICLIFRNKIKLDIVHKAEALLGENYHVSSLSVDNFFTNVHSLAKTLLLEGKSIISGSRFACNLGLTAKLLYSYDLSSESSSKKVRFVYLLRGRNGSAGLVKDWGGEFIAPSAFFVPIEKDNEAQEVFDAWKIKYARKKLMLMN